MSANERICDYLDQVCAHIFWPPYRARVRRELTDHILSRIEYLQNDRSYSEEEAVAFALSHMGDPDTLGIHLCKARFPLHYLLCLLATVLIWMAITGCAAYLLLTIHAL